MIEKYSINITKCTMDFTQSHIALIGLRSEMVYIGLCNDTIGTGSVMVTIWVLRLSLVD